MPILLTHKPSKLTRSHVTPQIFSFLPPIPPSPPAPLSPVLRTDGKSAGLHVGKEAPLTTQGPISLVQMHRVSWKFQANRHLLFKQLWGYPQEEACPSRFCSFPTFETTKVVMCRTDWVTGRSYQLQRRRGSHFLSSKWVSPWCTRGSCVAV